MTELVCLRSLVDRAPQGLQGVPRSFLDLRNLRGVGDRIGQLGQRLDIVAFASHLRGGGADGKAAALQTSFKPPIDLVGGQERELVAGGGADRDRGVSDKTNHPVDSGLAKSSQHSETRRLCDLGGRNERSGEGRGEIGPGSGREQRQGLSGFGPDERIVVPECLHERLGGPDSVEVGDGERSGSSNRGIFVVSECLAKNRLGGGPPPAPRMSAAWMRTLKDFACARRSASRSNWSGAQAAGGGPSAPNATKSARVGRPRAATMGSVYSKSDLAELLSLFAPRTAGVLDPPISGKPWGLPALAESPMRRSAPLLLAVTLLACNSDPSKPAYWVSRLSSKSVQQKVEACSKLRKMSDAADDDKIALLLKDEDPRVKQAAAEALGDLGAKSAVSDLAEALDFSVGGGSDRETRSINEANRAIALALGKLSDRKASPALLKLLRSRDHYVVLAAVESLGKLHETSAVDPLMAIATDDNQEPFIAKKAIVALGRIGDVKAVPAIERMLFKERSGVSFYPESSFAVFQIGEPAATPLINLLDGKDKALEKWAEDNQILPEALFAKTAQLLGDVGDVRADSALLGKLKYESESDLKLLVRANAAESLGRLRDKAAAKPIAAMLGESEANIRDSYGRALVLIGDRDVVPELEKACTSGNWDDREGSIHALSNLGTGKEVPFLEKLIAAEPAAWAKECKDAGNDDASCKSAEGKHQATLKGHLARLVAAKECGEKGDCWLGKLKDPQGPVRERAAFELGREGDPKAIPALLEALKDDDLFARFAENTALGWLINGSPAGKAQAKAAADRLNAILEDEDGKVYYIKVDEDLKRLAARLEKLTQSPT